MTNPTQLIKTPEEETTDVHQALQEAVHESNSLPPMINFSTRMHENTKTDAIRICKIHGTDLSTYLRKCTEALVKAYGVTR